MNVHSIFIYKSLELKKIQMSNNRWIYKQIIECKRNAQEWKFENYKYTKTRIDLKNSMLRERNQTKKVTDCMIPFTWSSICSYRLVYLDRVERSWLAKDLKEFFGVMEMF